MWVKFIGKARKEQVIKVGKKNVLFSEKNKTEKGTPCPMINEVPEWIFRDLMEAMQGQFIPVVDPDLLKEVEDYRKIKEEQANIDIADEKIDELKKNKKTKR